MARGVKGAGSPGNRAEAVLTAAMATYLFLVIAVFWVQKPLKKTRFFEFYGTRTLDLGSLSLSAAQAELLAKILNMVVAYGAVILFTVLARRLRREKLTLAFSGLFAVIFVAFAAVVRIDAAPVVWALYLAGDLYSTLMVATFFAFLNDSFSPETARRRYGPIVLGGVAGGAFSPSIVAALSNSLAPETWMLVCLGLSGVIAAVAYGAGVLVGRAPPAEVPARGGAEPRPRSEAGKRSPASEGARLVLRSPYLLSIVALVALYEIVSTIMDFQFSATVEHFDELGVIEKKSFIPGVYAVTNWVALLVQVLGTSFVMSRFRLTVALMVLPVAALSSSLLYLLVPLATTGALLNTADNGLSYSLNQSAREALYTATTREEKYQAKAFIDMFVQRSAKALGVGLSLGISVTFASFESVRWLSLVTLGVVVLWALAARNAGRRFHVLARSG